SSPVPRLMLTAERTHDPTLLSRDWDHSLIDLDHRMAAMASQQHVAYISMIKLLCHNFSCSYMDLDGLPAIADREHFTMEGSLIVAKKLQHLRVWQIGTDATTPSSTGIDVGKAN
ncbi:MAG: hypothetical protein KGL92_11415, partial [Gammaproteobacteria bacterium]|nr:hypothetical protein [Gammaproteobacteria bacterium]